MRPVCIVFVHGVFSYLLLKSISTATGQEAQVSQPDIIVGELDIFIGEADRLRMHLTAWIKIVGA